MYNCNYVHFTSQHSLVSTMHTPATFPYSLVYVYMYKLVTLPNFLRVRFPNIWLSTMRVNVRKLSNNTGYKYNSCSPFCMPIIHTQPGRLLITGNNNLITHTNTCTCILCVLKSYYILFQRQF
jgi:hypothetical protein